MDGLHKKIVVQLHMEITRILPRPLGLHANFTGKRLACVADSLYLLGEAPASNMGILSVILITSQLLSSISLKNCNFLNL